MFLHVVVETREDKRRQVKTREDERRQEKTREDERKREEKTMYIFCFYRFLSILENKQVALYCLKNI